MMEVQKKPLDDFIGKTEELPGTLVRKYQKCGKKGCRCQRGFLHGPYYWRVFYDKVTKKQHWKYIGKMIKNGL